MSLVSCILPTYNRPQFALDTISTLLGSPHGELEIIVVNDGGTKFEYNDKRVKIIELEENSQSVSIPRNIGISWAQGEYICHTDDDVVHFPDKIPRLHNALRDYGDLLAFGQRHECHVLETKNSLFATVSTGTRVIPTPKDEWIPTAEGGWGVDNGQIMYLREVYDWINPVFSRRACDWELAKEIYKVSTGFTSIKEAVCMYIWHNNNRSKDNSTQTRKIYPAKFAKYFDPSNMPKNLPESV